QCRRRDSVSLARRMVTSQSAEHDVFAHGQLLEGLWNLECPRKATPGDLIWLAVIDGSIEKSNRPGCRDDGPRDEIEKGTFSGAIRPDDPDDLAGLYGEADVAYGPSRTELAADSIKFQHHNFLAWTRAAKPAAGGSLEAARLIAPETPDGKYKMTMMTMMP